MVLASIYCKSKSLKGTFEVGEICVVEIYGLNLHRSTWNMTFQMGLILVLSGCAWTERTLL